MHTYAYTKIQVCTFASTCTEIVHKHAYTYNLKFSLYPSIPNLNSELPVLSTLNPFCKILLAQGPCCHKVKDNNDTPSVTPGLRMGSEGLLRPKVTELRVASVLLPVSCLWLLSGGQIPSKLWPLYRKHG